MGSLLSRPAEGAGGGNPTGILPASAERRRFIPVPAEVDKYLSADGTVKLNEVHGQLDSYTFVRKRIGEARRSRLAVANGGTADFYVARRASDGHFFGLRQVSLRRAADLFDDGGNSFCSAAETLSRDQIATMVEFVRLRYGVHAPLEVLLNRRHGESKAYVIDELMETGIESQAERLRTRCGQRLAGRFYLSRLGEPLGDLIRGGALHADIKPSNFLARGAEVRLTDFFGSDVGQKFRQRAKTDAYLTARRQAKGQVTVRSELYALGVSVIELMTGTHPLLGGRGDAPIGVAAWASAWQQRHRPHPRPDEAIIERFEALFAHLRQVDPPLGIILEQLADPSESEAIDFPALLTRTRDDGDLALTAAECMEIEQALQDLPAHPTIAAAKAQLVRHNEGRRPYRPGVCEP